MDQSNHDILVMWAGHINALNLNCSMSIVTSLAIQCICTVCYKLSLSSKFLSSEAYNISLLNINTAGK